MTETADRPLPETVRRRTKFNRLNFKSGQTIDDMSDRYNSKAKERQTTFSRYFLLLLMKGFDNIKTLTESRRKHVIGDRIMSRLGNPNDHISLNHVSYHNIRKIWLSKQPYEISLAG